MKTLIVDDDPILCRLLASQLAALDVGDVRSHVRGREALVQVARGEAEVGLIFADLRMPELDGIEFVRELARFGYRGSLILMSGEDPRILHSAERLARAHGLRVLGSLSKPTTPAGLRAVLDRHVSGMAASQASFRTFYSEELRRAIAAGALVNHYQPTVSLTTGAVVGVESLVRWNHPERGLVYPDEFVPLAEQSGLIDELTQAVLRTALDDARRWFDAGYALQIAVNVSMDNLVALDFPEMVMEELAASGVPPERLVLEVTESRLMQNSVVVLDILARLRLRRITLSIDDFGTGHSSLVQLRDLPFNELKIDRGFVHGACEDEGLRAIVEANQRLARSLGLRTVAEGVETRAEWELLRSCGCDFAQGWFVSSPMPGHELPEWFEDWEIRRPRLLEPLAEAVD
ncbi:EAL domain-containing protein [Aromatoleum petrolei]|uniref:EAL domain-containing protein n=1 Tax=Aromatoleum petrolei TaxID=76116 RepID=A0ABX1MTF8_9RHOO|nr:EAL domain-containing protein [Aromatoleum petrolei]